MIQVTIKNPSVMYTIDAVGIKCDVSVTVDGHVVDHHISGYSPMQGELNVLRGKFNLSHDIKLSKNDSKVIHDKIIEQFMRSGTINEYMKGIDDVTHVDEISPHNGKFITMHFDSMECDDNNIVISYTIGSRPYKLTVSLGLLNKRTHKIFNVIMDKILQLREPHYNNYNNFYYYSKRTYESFLEKLNLLINSNEYKKQIILANNMTFSNETFEKLYKMYKITK